MTASYERVGVTLSGGGARGQAHIGAMRALREVGIEPVVLSGASSGALVASLWAAGLPPDEVRRLVRSIDPVRAGRYTVFKPGLLDPEPLVEAWRAYLPATFSDLDIELHINVTDILAGAGYIFSEGDLAPAVVASCCYPPFVSPLWIGDRLFVDGGVTDNLPTIPIRDRCDLLIAIDVNPLEVVEPESVQGTLSLTYRSLDIMHNRTVQTSRRWADVLVCPPGLARYAALFTREEEELQEIERLGYEETRDALEGIV